MYVCVHAVYRGALAIAHSSVAILVLPVDDDGGGGGGGTTHPLRSRTEFLTHLR